MWSAYLSLKTYHRRPSEDLELEDSIAVWCVDNAVLTFGLLIETLLAERDKVGVGREERWENRYTLSQLLDSSFHPPRPEPRRRATTNANPFAALLALAGDGRSGVRKYAYVKPS